MIVVSTPTGQIGRQVLEHLLGSSEPVRVIVRDASRLSSRVRDRVEVISGSHGDLDIVDKAFAGADAVFWLVSPDPRASSAEAAYVDFTRPACGAFRDTASDASWESPLSAAVPWADRAGLVTASLKMDDLIATTGVSYRAVINPSFMDNLLRQVEAIKTQGAFLLPISGDLRQPSACTRDIAATAARLLLDRSWNGTGSVPVPRPRRSLLQRHGANHVRRPQQAGAFRAHRRRCLQDQIAQGRHVRRDGPSNARHVDGIRPGPRHARTSHPRVDDAHELPAVVRGRPETTHAVLK